MFAGSEAAFDEHAAGWLRKGGALAAGQSTQGPRAGTSDRDLIDLIAHQDRRAMELLYVRHSIQVYRFVLRMVGDASLAEDIVSDVFLEVWRKARGFQARSQVSTWLIAIARNKWLTARKRHHESSDEQRVAAIADLADDPEIACDKNDRTEIIRGCLERLPPAQREVVDLVYYHGRSIAEIARIVGVPIGTVKTRMFHARRRMERLLGESGISRH